MRTRGFAFTLAAAILSIFCISVPLTANASNINLPLSSSPLPAGISQVVNSAVDLEYKGASGNQIEQSSGVKIAPNLTLSAGHEFLANGLIEVSQSDGYCRPLSIYSTGEVNDEKSTDNSIVATFSKTVPGLADVSLINTSTDAQFDKLPIPEIGPTPGLGSQLYFVNYEPAANLVARNPNPNAGGESSFSYSKPAVYSGVILDSAGQYYLAATGIKSYGQGMPDDISRPGASGGPVFNQSGQLVGIVTAIIDEQFTSQQISQMYGINLPVSSQAMLQLDEIQPVTPQIISAYETLLNNPSSRSANVNFCVRQPSATLPGKTGHGRLASIARGLSSGILSLIHSL